VIVAVVFLSCALIVVWIYAGYPLFLAVVGRVRPRPRRRARIEVPVSVIVAAHNEEPIIEKKVVNARATEYPPRLVEVIVASDGSTDATAARARTAGASHVLELPRVGKLRALNDAVAHSSGEILVFSDADAFFLFDTLPELVANFADPAVGAVSANEIHVQDVETGVGRGEGLYWRYEQSLKRLEDRVGSTVSASGRLYALRRECFVESSHTVAADDFLLSTQAILAGRRLAYDERARVLVTAPDEGGPELRRKVRMMNQGLRAALALAAQLSPIRDRAYLAQLLFHKILRRCVAFFLLGMFVAALVGAALGGAFWWIVVGLQLAFYSAAVAGAVVDRRRQPVPKPLWIPYYFCLSNLAAALAVCSLARATKFEAWDPAVARGTAAGSEATA
jgi:cellulose synthase/poly-beta-1,6-N-acetylglucosamine synthase-like glycosyltransferase